VNGGRLAPSGDVSLDERFTRTQPGEAWEQYYANDLLERFAA
jgi:hypothetical protein